MKNINKHYDRARLAQVGKSGTFSARVAFLAVPILFMTAESSAETGIAKTEGKGKWIPLEAELNLSAGHRVDDLNWNIAGNLEGNSPNILSELKWTQVKSVQVKAEANIVWPRVIAIKGYVDYGWIMDGDNQDSDYIGDNRTLEFSRSNNHVDGDYVSDSSIAIGYPVRFGDEAVGTLTPLVGHSNHEQNLNMTDGYQTIDVFGGFVGPFPGLNSSYDAEWKGPWIGADLRFKAREIDRLFASRMETFFMCEYHMVDYHAEANWNLRTDLAHPKSFEHDADGDGWRFAVGFNLWLHNNLAVSFFYDYQDFSADDGIDTVYFSDGTVGQTRFNKVNWDAYSVNVGMSLRY